MARLGEVENEDEGLSHPQTSTFSMVLSLRNFWVSAGKVCSEIALAVRNLKTYFVTKSHTSSQVLVAKLLVWSPYWKRVFRASPLSLGKASFLLVKGNSANGKLCEWKSL